MSISEKLGTTVPEFRGFPKTTRMFSPVTVTEKIDGTNGVILIQRPENGGLVLAGSKNRWLIPDKNNKGWDNHGFGNWVYDNADNLRDVLGYGYHYGEWMGQSIARNYGLKHKQFMLFDQRYRKRWTEDDTVSHNTLLCESNSLSLVPVLYEGEFTESLIAETTDLLHHSKSAINGFERPEGFIVRWNNNGHILKVVLDK